MVVVNVMHTNELVSCDVFFLLTSYEGDTNGQARNAKRNK